NFSFIQTLTSAPLRITAWPATYLTSRFAQSAAQMPDRRHPCIAQIQRARRRQRRTAGDNRAIGVIGAMTDRVPRSALRHLTVVHVESGPAPIRQIPILLAHNPVSRILAETGQRVRE